MSRHVLICLLAMLLSVGETPVFARSWPSSTAPCNTTLQACVEASDTVLVVSNAVIAESIYINKPFVLAAGIGYRPILGAGNVIAGSVNAAGSWTWQVEGFELQQGYISLSINGGGAATVIVRNNRVLSDLSGASEISIVKNSSTTTTLNYEVAKNQLNYYWNIFDGALRSAMQVLDSGSGMSSGRISENRVVASGSSAIGILVNTQDRAHRSEVLGNHVLGGSSGSIYLRQGSLISATGGSLNGFVMNNVVRSITPGTRHAAGIKVEAYDGGLTLTALHNTVVDASNGIAIYVDSSVTEGGEVGGNLFAYLSSYGLQRGGAVGINDRDNLFFESVETPSTPGLSATSVFADPMLKSVPGDPHLRPGSPAIDRLASVALLEVIVDYNLPHTDGDGLRRFKHANDDVKSDFLDIGALEAGDETLLQRVPAAAPGNTASIDNSILNGFVLAAPQQVSNWNPGGFGGIYNDHPVSLLHNSASGRWLLRQEDLLNFSAGAAFNLFAPAAGSGRLNHINNAGNTNGRRTVLYHPDLNNHADYILLITRNPGSGTISNVVSPLAVNYQGGGWGVVRLDGLPMPSDGGFNVYFQEPSANAFRHQTGIANINGNLSYIDHPLLNNHRCARFHVTHLDNSIINNHHIGLYYAPAPIGRWSIFNQDAAAMTNSASFYVVVDPQAVDCADGVFANGFE